MAYIYPTVTATNLPTPIGGKLNGNYIDYNSLPNTVQQLISNPKYLVLVRETTNQTGTKGGRTVGTMWYNNKVLGFTVEDAVRDKKIQNKTAIPDTIEDPKNFTGIPSNVYNIILKGNTSSDRIKKSLVGGKGLRISSKTDNTGMIIYESDVYTDSDFSPRGNIAFDGVFIHGGTNEGSSIGCIIFSRTRNSDGKLKDEDVATIDLNKYLTLIGLIGSGKYQQFAIINLFDLPPPTATIESTVTIVNGETSIPINEEVKIDEIPPPLPIPTSLNIGLIEENL